MPPRPSTSSTPRRAAPTSDPTRVKEAAMRPDDSAHQRHSRAARPRRSYPTGPSRLHPRPVPSGYDPRMTSATAEKPDLDHVPGLIGGPRVGHAKNLLSRSLFASANIGLTPEVIRRMRRHYQVVSCLTV